MTLPRIERVPPPADGRAPATGRPEESPPALGGPSSVTEKASPPVAVAAMSHATSQVSLDPAAIWRAKPDRVSWPSSLP